MLTTYEVQIGRRTFKAASLREASEKYSMLRDRNGLCSSNMPDGIVWQGNVSVARISYNGKVWKNMEWKSGQEPIFDPYAAQENTSRKLIAEVA